MALFLTCLALVRDLMRIVFRPRAEIITKNLFLRRQLALYQECKARRRGPDRRTRFRRLFRWAVTDIDCRTAIAL